MVSCYGGGNKQCAQREKEISYIGAIVDTYGGIRVVVTRLNEFKDHVKPDEVLLVVRDKSKRIHMPIAWGDMPYVIALGKLEAEKWIERGEPNEPHAREAWRMYRLRCLELNQSKGSLDLNSIVET